MTETLSKTKPNKKPEVTKKTTGRKKNNQYSKKQLLQKIRRLERELNQYRSKQHQVIQQKKKMLAEKQLELQKQIMGIEKDNKALVQKVDDLVSENQALKREINRLMEELEQSKKNAGAARPFRQMWNEEHTKLRYISSHSKPSAKACEADEKYYQLLQRMDQFIEGGIREREQLIRFIDRVRDRSVQTIRVLEKEKAINLGLLKEQKISRKIAERVGVFVDVQNMFYAARQQFNSRLDFQQLLKQACRGRKLLTAVAYIVQTPEIDQSSFISFLTKSGFEVKSKDLKTRLDGSAKGNWDIEMAMDIMASLPELDVVVLVSGDGDFAPLVQKIQKDFHLRCEIYSFEHNTAVDLKEVCDLFVPIGKEMILDTIPERNNGNGRPETNS